MFDVSRLHHIDLLLLLCPCVLLLRTRTVEQWWGGKHVETQFPANVKQCYLCYTAVLKCILFLGVQLIWVLTLMAMCCLFSTAAGALGDVFL